jgi:hypothetical protein
MSANKRVKRALQSDQAGLSPVILKKSFYRAGYHRISSIFTG